MVATYLRVFYLLSTATLASTRPTMEAVFASSTIANRTDNIVLATNFIKVFPFVDPETVGRSPL